MPVRPWTLTVPINRGKSSTPPPQLTPSNFLSAAISRLKADVSSVCTFSANTLGSPDLERHAAPYHAVRAASDLVRQRVAPKLLSFSHAKGHAALKHERRFRLVAELLARYCHGSNACAAAVDQHHRYCAACVRAGPPRRRRSSRCSRRTSARGATPTRFVGRRRFKLTCRHGNGFHDLHTYHPP